MARHPALHVSPPRLYDLRSDQQRRTTTSLLPGRPSGDQELRGYWRSDLHRRRTVLIRLPAPSDFAFHSIEVTDHLEHVQRTCNSGQLGQRRQP
eukprot:2635440-Rhodomonas_salina.1